MKKHAYSVVDQCEGSDDTGSNEAYEIFEIYLSLYEEKLESFAEDEGLTHPELKKKLERVLESNITAQFMVKYMLMALEFDAFLEYCKTFVRENPKEEDEGKVDSASESKYAGDEEQEVIEEGKHATPARSGK